MSRRRSEKTKQSKKGKEDKAIRRRRLMRKQSPKVKKEKDKCEEESGKRVKFYGCYLLASLCPRFQGHTYIGFTVNPKRRIRQHNGEITSGAFRTKKKRPWEMVLCIHGFPTNVAALQFEWAWQHPRESIAVREAAASFKTLGGLANKIKLALTMLTLHTWQSMDLKVSFFSTKYMKHAAGCPNLPQQMKLHFCSMDELPCYGNSDLSSGCDDEDDIHSNDNRHSASDSDERLEPSARESIESDNIPYTIENSINEIAAVEPIGFGFSLENRSSSMMDPLEKGSFSMMEPLKNGSPSMIDSMETGSSLMIDTQEGGSSSMMDPLENGASVMMNPLENGASSIMDPRENSIMMDPVEVHLQPLHQLSVDINDSIGKDLSEHIGFSGVEELRSSFPGIEKHSYEAANKNNITCIVIDDIAEENCEPRRIMSPFRFVDTVRPYSKEGVEIIELCTPSPEFRITAGGKKKTFANDFPHIIDLTASPSFVEL